MILREIVENTRQEVDERQGKRSLEAVRSAALAASLPRPLPFDREMTLIAEVKRRSPSKGSFVDILDPVRQAAAYARGGAHAISVLTDSRFFGGSFADLAAVRAAVPVPVLCKDFILTSYQVYEARSHGADLILLIVAALGDGDLVHLQLLAQELGMMALVEVHDQHELARAVAADTTLIGINNRDLTDFNVDLATAEYLAPLAPDDAVVVAESGIATREDVRRMRQAGARAVLVGETLMRASDHETVIRELLA